MLRKLLIGVAASAALSVAGAGLAFAGNPSNTGQPNQSCQSQPSSPGRAANASGSAFNTTSGTSGSVYAGSPGTPSAANGNTQAVAQYDVACTQVSNH